MLACFEFPSNFVVEIPEGHAGEWSGHGGNSRLTNNVRQVRHTSVNTLESVWHRGRCHQRTCKRPCARSGEHARPPASPREEPGPLKRGWSISSPSSGQLFDELLLGSSDLLFPEQRPSDDICHPEGARCTSFLSPLVLFCI